MRKLKSSLLGVVVAATMFISSARPAHALGLGEAALTVGVSSAAGAILGASTLPFYPEMNEHTDNIWYGAAIGAVVGVLICGYQGLAEGRDAGEEAEEDAGKDARLNRLAPQDSTRPETTSALGMQNFATKTVQGSTLAWTPVVQFKW
jgi:hypothetical protein